MSGKKKEKLDVESLERTSEGKYIIELLKPVDYADEKISKLEITEPKTKHIRKLPTSPTMDDMLKVVADLVAQPDSFIDELSLKDSARLSEFIEYFS